MNKPEAHTANRIILAVIVTAVGAVLWLLAGDLISQHSGMPMTGKLWLGLVIGSALLTDTLYKRWSSQRTG